MKKNDTFCPNRILSYFRLEWAVLLIVTVSGLIYNIGLLASPWFEGRMTGCLIDILNGKKTFPDMLVLVAFYVTAIALVQICRYIKRFYVRRFSNNVNRRMKRVLYDSLIHKTKSELEEEGVGNVMTKAILDVDDCAEGMRKFTTEIFDTGVALAAYAGMLLYYDWHLAILCMIFPPVSYVLAEKLKVIVQKTGAAYKEQSGCLSSATLDRAVNAVTYRVFGCEKQREQAYEDNLLAYERSAIKANIWNTALTPLYRVISMASVLFILYFGSKNVLGNGWKQWSIAAFTTFLSCYSKLAVKSSRAAKLFNAVHKAQVSWKRIKPLMIPIEESKKVAEKKPQSLEIKNLSFAYPGKRKIINNVSFMAKPGQIIGVTGPVACGKSTLGKVFLCEYPYEGSIRFGGRELSWMDTIDRAGMIGYLGHDPELFNDTIENNICMGDKIDANVFLRAVCFENEVDAMENGIHTMIGNGGVRLSGGQGQRLALARTLAHKKPLLILDDPFSALDRTTEKQVFENLRKLAADSIVILISHRLYLFPQVDQVIWMNNGKITAADHAALMKNEPEYAVLFAEQSTGNRGSNGAQKGAEKR